MLALSTFGDRARSLREESNKNQTQLAEVLNTTQKKISRIETGENEPNLHDIQTLCRYYNVSADYLLGLIDIPKPLKEE